MGAEKQHQHGAQLARRAPRWLVPPQGVNKRPATEGGQRRTKGSIVEVSGPGQLGRNGSVKLWASHGETAWFPAGSAPLAFPALVSRTSPRWRPSSGPPCCWPFATPSHQSAQLGGSFPAAGQQPHDGLAVASQPDGPMASHLWLETPTPPPGACAGPLAARNADARSTARLGNPFSSGLATAPRGVRGLWAP